MKKIFLLSFYLIIISGAIAAQTGKGYSLEDCRQLALKHNQKLKIADEQVQASEELRKAAFTQYLPSFSINGTYTGMTKEFQLLKQDMFLPVVPYNAIDASTGKLSSAALSTPSIAASTFVINPATGKVVTDASGNPVFRNYSYLPASETMMDFRNIFMLNAGFTQPVFLGGKIYQLNRIAKANESIANNNKDLASDDLLFTVEDDYWRVISLEEKVKLCQDYKSMLEKLLYDLQNYRKEGIISENDLLRAKVRLTEVDLMLLKASNGLELSKMVLCQLTGLDYNNSPVFADPEALDIQDISIDSLPGFKPENRPEIRILNNGIEIADASVGIMKSRFLPNIALSAGFIAMNPDLYKGFTKEFGSDFTVGIVCNIPIFHFGEKARTLNAAKHERNAARLKLEETSELITLQVRQSEFRYTESARKTSLALLSLGQAKENLRVTNDNFAEGRLKTTDILEAQAAWQKAVSELIDAKAEQHTALSNLKKVKGIH